MTLAIRVIPCLDVHDGRVVKGVNFTNLRDAGDPMERRLCERRGEAERMLGRYEEALRAYARAEALSVETGDRIRVKTLIGRALLSKG